MKKLVLFLALVLSAVPAIAEEEWLGIYLQGQKIGWTHTVASEVGIHVPDAVRRMRDDPATEMETSMHEALSAYGFAPELMLSAGYRF